MNEINPIGVPAIRMKKIDFQVASNLHSGQTRLNVNLETRELRKSSDGQRLFLDIILKITETNKKFSGEFQMQGILKLTESFPIDQINPTDTATLEKIIRHLLTEMFEQISLSVSTVLAQFGLSPINLFKTIKPDTIKIKQPPQ